MKNFIFMAIAIIFASCNVESIEKAIANGTAYAEHQLVDLSTGERFSIPYTGNEPYQLMSYSSGDTVIVSMYYMDLLEDVRIYGPNSNALLGKENRVSFVDSLSILTYVRCKVQAIRTKEVKNDGVR